MNDLSQGVARRVIPIRASSIGELFDCAARWEAKYLRGMKLPKSGAAHLGTAVHKSTAVHDQAKLDGSPLKADESVAAAVDAIYKPEEDVQWDEDYSANAAETTARALHTKYCAEIAPKQDYAAVEVRCTELEIEDLAIALTGTTDRVRRVGDGYGIADLKTGKTAVRADGHVETAGHAMQQGVYELMAERAAGLPITEPALIIGMQTGKTDKAQRIATAEVHGAREMLIGEPDAPGVLELASRVIHSGAFPGNPRSMLCSEKYCPAYNNCRFRR